MADYTVSSHIDNLMQSGSAAESRGELGLGTLSTLNAAPAGTLTGTTLNSTVVTSSLTSVGTLGSLTVSGTTTLGMASASSSSFPPLEGIRTTTSTSGTFSAHSFTATTTADMIDGFGALATFSISDNGVGRTSIASIGAVRAGADNTGDLVFNTSAAGVSSEGMRLKSNNRLLIGSTTDNASGNLQVTGGLGLDKTITPAGTTGARTINKAAGSVNFAASATSLVVTNSLVTTSSVIMVTVTTNDTAAKSCSAVAASGSFTIRPNAAPAAETRVDFLVIN